MTGKGIIKVQYKHNIANCFESKIGQSGANEGVFQSYLEACVPIISDLREKQQSGNLPLLSLPHQQDDLVEIKQIGSHIIKHFKTLVVLGTGGSTLNPQALVALKPASRHVIFCDNIDPHAFSTLMDGLDMVSTAFLAISKSGSTAETMSQTLAIIALLGDSKLDVGKHLFIITEPTGNLLCQLAEKYSATSLDHHLKVGGRFSGLTNVGLLPAYVAGVDIDAIRAGAKEVVDTHLADIHQSESAMGAALALALEEKGVTKTILMPYIERLRCFTTWVQQIWGESLGKNGHFTTPIAAMGTLDQHSQLQLYLDGKKDKLFSLFVTDCQGEGASISRRVFDHEDLSYIYDKTMGDVNAASQYATANTLVNNGCPTRTFHFPILDEKTLGALMMHMMLETIITAQLLEINAFDQPAVEEGKVLCRELLASGTDLAFEIPS